MTLHRVKSVAFEASLILADLAVMFGACAVCKLLGHREPLRWQAMAQGRVGVCERCSSTVVV